MNDKFIVKKSKEFETIIHQGKYHTNPCFVMYYIKNDLSYNRFGITISKKVGNAVIRNRYKRKLREIIRNNENFYENNLDCIIIIRKDCLKSSYQELEKRYIELKSKREESFNEEKI